MTASDHETEITGRRRAFLPSIAKPLDETASYSDPAEAQERKDAFENATHLLKELEIYDIGNVKALLNAGYKSTPSFVKRMPLLDEVDRRSCLQVIVKGMGKIDYGILKVYFKKHGLDLDS